MQERKITLIDIGAGALPAVTPVEPQQTSWFPLVYVSPDTPPVEGVVPSPVADGVLIEWTAVDQEGVIYIIERGPTENGPWEEIARVIETRYLYSDGSGQAWWFKITASVRGKPGDGTTVEAAPSKVPSYAEMAALNQAIIQEILDRAAGDLAAANEAIDTARQYTDSQVAALNAFLEDIVGADEWVADREYPAGAFARRGGMLYQAAAPSTGVVPGNDPASWREIGEYASVGDALAASISMGHQNASDIAAEAVRVDAVVARLPAGAGQLATSAQVASEIQARVDDVAALGQRIDTTNAALGDKASTAQVAAVETASVSRDSVLGQRLDQTNAVLGGKAEAGTVAIMQSKVEQLDGRVDAQGSAITQVTAKLGGTPNMLKDSSFARGFTYWAQPGGLGIVNEPRYGNYMYAPPISGGTASPQTVQTGQGVYVFSGEVYRNSNAGTVRLEVAAYSANGYIGAVSALSDPSIVGQWQQVYIAIAAPAGTTYLVCRPIWENTNANNSIRRMKLELGLTPTLWTDDTAVQLAATATQILETRATQLENGQSVLYAKYTWALDVNNRVIGMTSVNNGLIGRIDFVADIFNITDPNGTGSMTWEGGRTVQRWANSGYILAQGKPFGNLGDLVMYYGQGSDPATVVKANAKFALDTAGNVFIAGALYTGGISRGFKSSTTVAQGVAVETGYLGRLGREVQVGGRFQYQYQQQYNGASSVITLGPGSTSAVVVLERNFAGDPTWTELSRLTLGGSDDVFNEQGAASFITQTISGQIFATDVASARQTSFRTRVLSYDRRGHSVSNPGPTPLALQSQYQSIESME